MTADVVGQGVGANRTVEPSIDIAVERLHAIGGIVVAHSRAKERAYCSPRWVLVAGSVVKKRLRAQNAVFHTPFVSAEQGFI